MLLDQMERLNKLRDEYVLINSRLDFPFSVSDRYRMYDRRKELLSEARILAASVNISGDHWFNAETGRLQCLDTE
jgi:hypothetical protein